MRRACIKVENIVLAVIGFLGLLFILDQHGTRIGDPILRSAQTAVHDPIGDHVIVPSNDYWVTRPLAVCQENTSMAAISGFEDLPVHIKDFLRFRHCRHFPILLDVPNKCGGPKASNKIFLFLVIKSSPDNYERREIIRKTWGKEMKYEGVHVRRLFITGVYSNERISRRLNKLLQIERREHQDILQWDFFDSFFNLTLKQVLFHQWMEKNCPGARFIFNGDDDVFVNTYNMVRYLLGMSGSNHSNPHLFVGQLIVNVGPIREAWSKYYVPVQVTTSNSYPPYCGGGGILMSGFTARTIHKMSLDIELLPIDDVYLGMCLAKAGLQPASHMGMRTVGVNVPSAKLDAFDPCYYKELLMVHRFVPYEMLVMWQAIQDPNIVCGKKVEVYMGM
ncbi:N-acetyllactosaminide beta-1,3-N-acetylglucosaminyltransferase 3 [Ambystoma mexicanum]|uniref:N-acetyllactosaminide beta-1,3-N-acetylglucosaminyltransferase 3 n=1 Tax=Ambystoma mexicanum TaxID=8296 RepID=UPI0037E72662